MFYPASKCPIVSGIYKITSPSGKVYIGQSWDIAFRWKEHRRTKKGNCHIMRSIAKYGRDAHAFTICHILPKDATQDTMDAYEQLYCDLYKSAGVVLMNIREGKRGGKLTEEAREKLRQCNLGKRRNYVITERHRKILSDRMKGKLVGNQYGKKNLGKKHGPHSNERKDKISKGHSKHKWHIFRDGQLLGVYDNSKIAAQQIGLPWSTVRRIKNSAADPSQRFGKNKGIVIKTVAA